ncbi:MAG TPA: TIGR00266 family protein [Actinomycetota bacterium]|nr:TIGR00266 family protein [Actinomycetota bacterium]
MNVEVLHAPSYSLAVARLNPDESIQAESAAMVSMSGHIQMDTQAKGGLLGGLKRSFLGGESFFINTFTSPGAEGEVTLAPKAPGDIRHMVVTTPMFVQSGSYLASAPSIAVDTKWGGAKTFFSGEGLFLLHVTGSGDLIISSYGAIHEVELAPGQVYMVDTSHIVAFAEGVQYEVKKVGGWKQTILSGEGLVCQLTGPGKIYLQTRSPHALVQWLAPMLPQQNSS